MVLAKQSPVTIPRSMRAATDRLATLDGLATATGWERAAIVYAFTEPQPGRRNLSGHPARLTLAEFAGLGIAGLSNKDTVAHYRRCWTAAMEAGEATDVVPGSKVTLPTSTFPPRDPTHAGNNASAARVAERITRDESYAREVLAEPATRQAVREALAVAARLPEPPEPTIEDHVLDSIGETLQRRGSVADCLATLTDAIDALHSALLRLDREERTAYTDSLASVVDRLTMVAAIVEGVPDDLSVLDR